MLSAVTAAGAREFGYAAVRQVLASYRFRFQNEAELQLGIATALEAAGIAFEREVRFDAANRIDFLLPGGLGIEVKIDGSSTQLVRQLVRYADRPEVSELLLVTSKPTLSPTRGADSAKICGKPLHVYVLPPEMA